MNCYVKRIIYNLIYFKYFNATIMESCRVDKGITSLLFSLPFHIYFVSCFVLFPLKRASSPTDASLFIENYASTQSAFSRTKDSKREMPKAVHTATLLIDIRKIIINYAFIYLRG